MLTIKDENDGDECRRRRWSNNGQSIGRKSDSSSLICSSVGGRSTSATVVHLLEPKENSWKKEGVEPNVSSSSASTLSLLGKLRKVPSGRCIGVPEIKLLEPEPEPEPEEIQVLNLEPLPPTGQERETEGEEGMERRRSKNRIHNSNLNLLLPGTCSPSSAQQSSSSSSFSPSASQRKLSLPANYYGLSPSSYLEEKMTVAKSHKSSVSTPNSTFDSSRKRLSAVGIAVSHSLQSTIGWKKFGNQEEIVEKARSLCAVYFRFKLQKCGLVHKKLGLQRLKSMGQIANGSSGGTSVTQTYLELKKIIQELEKRHPKLYSSVVSNIGNPVGLFASKANVQHVFLILSQEQFRNDITWCRIAAYYAIAGALAVDCVKAGHPDYVLGIINTLTNFVELDIAPWIAQQGGWESLGSLFRCEDQWERTLRLTLFLIFCPFTLILTYFFLMP